jgi:hypothetical protein
MARKIGDAVGKAQLLGGGAGLLQPASNLARLAAIQASACLSMSLLLSSPSRMRRFCALMSLLLTS